jgi:CheY-like chemotaxis protein
MDSPLSGKRVLVVEDEIMVSWLLADMLGDLGCVVVGPAVRVEQALSIIESEPLDAAVVDLNLNGQISYPVADALAARDVPFIFSSGYAPDRLLEKYRSCPVLQKPFHRSELAEVLAKLLTPKGKAASRR